MTTKGSSSNLISNLASELTLVSGVILAGGRSQRMQCENKPLLRLDQQTLLHHVIRRAQPQVKSLLLSVNQSFELYAAYGLPMTTDLLSGHLGPLAGIYSAMQWVKENRPASKWLASFAADTPFFPTNMVAKLMQELIKTGSQIACVSAKQRLQPTFALYPIDLSDALFKAITQKKVSSLKQWISTHSHCKVVFEQQNMDQFFNINTPEDLQQAQQILAQAK